MEIERVTQVRDIGHAAHRMRKDSRLDQATTAGLAGVGPRFLSELERGKDSVRMGLVLQVLERLGLELWIAPRGWSPHERTP